MNKVCLSTQSIYGEDFKELHLGKVGISFQMHVINTLCHKEERKLPHVVYLKAVWRCPDIHEHLLQNLADSMRQ